MSSVCIQVDNDCLPAVEILFDHLLRLLPVRDRAEFQRRQQCRREADLTSHGTGVQELVRARGLQEQAHGSALDRRSSRQMQALDDQLGSVARGHQLEIGARGAGEARALPGVELVRETDVERLSAGAERIAFGVVHREHQIRLRAVIRLAAVGDDAFRALQAKNLDLLGELHDDLSALKKLGSARGQSAPQRVQTPAEGMDGQSLSDGP